MEADIIEDSHGGNKSPEMVKSSEILNTPVIWKSCEQLNTSETLECLGKSKSLDEFHSPEAFSSPILTPITSPEGSLTKSKKSLFFGKPSIKNKSIYTTKWFDYLVKHGKTQKSAVRRDQWTHYIHFNVLLSMYFFGYGDLIDFPYRMLKYGFFPFCCVYLICVFIYGYPLILMEAALGQFCSYGPTRCWEYARLFKGIGVFMIIVSVIYGSTNISTLIVMTISLTSNNVTSRNMKIAQLLGWSEIPTTYNSTNFTIKVIKPETVTFLGYDVLLLYLLHWFVAFLGLLPSIPTRGKVWSVIFAFVVLSLTVILVKCVFLPGATDALLLMFKKAPDSKFLFEYDLWKSALRRLSVSIGSGYGITSTLSSYNDFHNTIHKDVLFVTCCDLLWCMYGTFFTISIMGHEAEMSGMNLDTISRIKKTHFIHLTVPEVLSDGGSFLIKFWFLFTLGFGHGIITASLEVAVTGVMDFFNYHQSQRKKAAFYICLSSVVLSSFMCTSICPTILKIMFTIGYSLIVLSISLPMVISIAWVYGVDNFLFLVECCVGWDNSYILSHPYSKRFWKVCWKYILPSFLTLQICVHIFKDSSVDEDIQYICEILFFILLMVLQIWREEGPNMRSKIRSLLKPTKNWHPMLNQKKMIVEMGDEERRRIKRSKKSKKSLAKTYEELSLSMH